MRCCSRARRVLHALGPHAREPDEVLERFALLLSQEAFQGAAALTSVNMPKVTEVGIVRSASCLDPGACASFREMHVPHMMPLSPPLPHHNSWLGACLLLLRVNARCLVPFPACLQRAFAKANSLEVIEISSTPSFIGEVRIL